jgi:uncharacterized membrane protein
MSRVRQHFLTGVLTITPVAVTAWILWRLYLFVDRALRPLLERIRPLETLPDVMVTVLGVVLSAILILLVGLVSRNLIGKAFFGLVERLLHTIPIVKGIFTAVKQIAEVFLGDGRQAFQRVVLFEYPRRGLWSLGFLTKDDPARDLIHVFLPTTPNPTSGYLLLVPRADARFPDISVEDGIRLIISGGAVASEKDAESLCELSGSTRTEEGGEDA